MVCFKDSRLLCNPPESAPAFFLSVWRLPAQSTGEDRGEGMPAAAAAEAATASSRLATSIACSALAMARWAIAVASSDVAAMAVAAEACASFCTCGGGGLGGGFRIQGEGQLMSCRHACDVCGCMGRAEDHTTQAL